MDLYDRLTFNIVSETPEVSYLLNNKFTVFIQEDSTKNEYRVTAELSLAMAL